MRRTLILILILVALPGCFHSWSDTDYIQEGEDAVEYIRDHGYQVFHDPDMYNMGAVSCFLGKITVYLQDIEDQQTAAHEWQHVQDFERLGCAGPKHQARAYAAEWVYRGCKGEDVEYFLDNRAASWMLDPDLCSVDFEDVDSTVFPPTAHESVSESIHSSAPS